MSWFVHYFKAKPRTSDRVLILGSLVILLTTSCAGLSGGTRVHQYLDESTGVTVTSLTAPIAFFNEEPMLAANARDYVYVGPAELNRTGQRETVLWLNFCSTIDRGRRSGPYRPDKVFLLVDGTPMELVEPEHRINVNEWSYVAPVNGGSQQLFSVTRRQLGLLGQATDVRVVAEERGRTRTYTRWDENHEEFRQFSAYLGEAGQYFATSEK